MARERQFDIEDNRAQLHVTGTRQSIRMPSGLGMWTPKKPGSYRLEFIPFLVTANHNRYTPDLRFSKPGKWYPERTFFVHSGIGVDNASYTCPLKTFGKPCPICEVRARLTKSPHKEDEERAYSLKPRERQMFLIMERSDRGELSNDVKLWEVSNWNWGRNLEKYIDAADAEDRDAFKRYYHPINGFTVKVTASEETMGGGGGGKFLEFTVHEFKARKEPLDLEIFDHGFDLDDMVRELDYTALKELFLGGGDPDDDAPPAETKPAGNGRAARPPVDDDDAPPAKPARKPEPADDDVPPPAAKRKPAPEPDPEPAPTAKPTPVEFATGDVVAFKYRGKPMEGTIRKVRDLIAHVVVDGFEKEMIMDFDELTMVRADDTFDTKPATKPARKPDPEPEPEPAPRAKRKPAEDDDAPPPATKRKPAAEPEPEPKAKPAAGRSKWDDDDDGSVAFKRKPAEDDDAPPAKRTR